MSDKITDWFGLFNPIDINTNSRDSVCQIFQITD